jgi:hypothetical protein
MSLRFLKAVARKAARKTVTALLTDPPRVLKTAMVCITRPSYNLSGWTRSAYNSA